MAADGPTQALDWVSIPDAPASAKSDSVDSAWGRLVSLAPETHGHVELRAPQVVLGRQSGCDVRLCDLAISGRHCRVFREEGSGLAFVEDLSTNGTFVDGAKVGQHRRALLRPGSELALLNRKRKIAFVFQQQQQQSSQETAAKDASGGGELGRKYAVGDVLGTGTFAVVRFGVERATGTRVAVKVIDKKRFSAQAAARKDKILDEVHILQTLDHPHIIRIHDVFDTPTTLSIVLELMTGGDLLEHILESPGGCVAEDRARPLFVQVASAVAYLHGRGVAHRDLKPENLMLTDKTHTSVKVTDFGLSKVIDEGSYTRTVCGTPQFLAPEILEGGAHGGYSLSCDLWSLGCILYTMLCGTPPFDDTGGRSIFEKIRRGLFSFSGERWKDVSPASQDLVCRLLVLDPRERLAASRIPEHPWCKGMREMPELSELPEIFRKRYVPPVDVPEPQRQKTDDLVQIVQGPAVAGSMSSSTAAAPTSMVIDASMHEPSAKRADTRPLCKYGERCYRKNPEHLAQFRHPWRDTQQPQQQQQL